MKNLSAFTVRVTDDVFIALDEYSKKIGVSRNAVVQMLLNFGVMYAKEQGIIGKDE